jgi:cobalt/nickel transport protein
MRFLFLSTVIGIAAAGPAQAHYHILLPDRHSVKAAEEVTVTYAFGHPFEHEMFEAQKPARATLFAPDGKATDVLPGVEKIDFFRSDEKKVAAYKLVLKPATRGDYTLVFESPPIWMKDDKQFLRDTVRVVIHVETQKGWDARAARANEFALVPLTRPYGLRAGAAFQAMVHANESAGVSHLVEAERFNPQPPRALPPDEHMTLAVKTDTNGTATVTLPDPGWWGLTAVRRYPAELKPPTRENDGKAYPVIERATLWVLVEVRVPLKPTE